MNKLMQSMVVNAIEYQYLDISRDKCIDVIKKIIIGVVLIVIAYTVKDRDLIFVLLSHHLDFVRYGH